MATSDFLPFGTDPAANVDTQANYAATTYRAKGFQSGIAHSPQLNKVWRQSSVVSAAWSNVITQIIGQNVHDDGNVTNLTNQLIQAIQGIVSALINPQVVTVPFSATPVFDCSKANPLIAVFAMTLSGNVTSSSLTNAKPGQLVTISVTQDSAGGRTFVWPTPTYGGGSIDTAANQVNVQEFEVGLGGELQALAGLVIRN